MEIYEKSTDYPAGVVPFTRAVIPSANILSIAGKWIGLVQQIDEKQNRDVTEHYEVGSVGPVELTPGQPSYSLSLSHVKIYQKHFMKILMELSYAEKYGETAVKDAITGQMSGDSANKNAEVFSLISHNILPIDLEVWELNYGVDQQGNPIDFNLDIPSKGKLITKYIDCWITSYTKPIAASGNNLVEQMEVKCRRISFKSA